MLISITKGSPVSLPSKAIERFPKTGYPISTQVHSYEVLSQYTVYVFPAVAKNIGGISVAYIPLPTSLKVKVLSSTSTVSTGFPV